MRKNRYFAMISCVLIVFLGLSGCSRRGVEAAPENRQPTVTPAQQDFMMKTAESDLSDIAMAQLALRKSANAGVRDFANMIQRDHTSALEDLTDIMKDKNVSLPKGISADTQKDLIRMNGLIGPEFDREFMNTMVSDHQRAVDMFHDQIAIALDADVKKYAADLLPKLDMHLEKAQRIQSSLVQMK